MYLSYGSTLVERAHRNLSYDDEVAREEASFSALIYAPNKPVSIGFTYTSTGQYLYEQKMFLDILKELLANTKSYLPKTELSNKLSANDLLRLMALMDDKTINRLIINAYERAFPDSISR